MQNASKSKVFDLFCKFGPKNRGKQDRNFLPLAFSKGKSFVEIRNHFFYVTTYKAVVILPLFTVHSIRNNSLCWKYYSAVRRNVT